MTDHEKDIHHKQQYLPIGVLDQKGYNSQTILQRGETGSAGKFASWSRMKTRSQNKPTTIADLAFTKGVPAVPDKSAWPLPLNLESITSDKGRHDSLYSFLHATHVIATTKQ